MSMLRCQMADSSENKNSTEEDFSVSGYEYLDHPADVQLHSWAPTLKEAFEQVALAMFGVMTELTTVESSQEENVKCDGHDLESLLYSFLDECLFVFSAEPYLCACAVNITEFDKQNFTIKASLVGEPFDLSKHPQGTEVKAITYSNMQILQLETRCECYVIVDI